MLQRRQPRLWRGRGADGIDLTVEAGEVVCLLGPSGCGKTTCFASPPASSARAAAASCWTSVSRRPSTYVPPEHRSIGSMFQDYALFPHLTVMQNVLFGLRALPREDAQTARDAAPCPARALSKHARNYPHCCPAASSSAWPWRGPWRRAPASC